MKFHQPDDDEWQSFPSFFFTLNEKRNHELKHKSRDFDDFSFGFCDDDYYYYYYCLFVCKFYLFLWLNEYYMDVCHDSIGGNQINNFSEAIKFSISY